jgi:hypothetical protein
LLLTGGEDIEHRLSSACKRLEWEKRLGVLPAIEENPFPTGSLTARSCKLHAVGVDKARIRGVATSPTTRSTLPRCRPVTAEPGTGTPIYMKIRIVPEDVDQRALRRELDSMRSRSTST